jgi:hypothetical protein
MFISYLNDEVVFENINMKNVIINSNLSNLETLMFKV